MKNLLILLMLSFFTVSHAQVVTSKKEAIKKGIYQQPDKAVVTTTPAKTTIVSKPATPAKTPVKVTAKSKTKAKKTIINDKNDDDVIIEPEENYLVVQMINNAMDFLGVNYRGGGTTIAGMDCSGMVTAVFNIFDMKLPRSSNEMARVGEKVDRNNVKKGDLVFFKTNGRRTINHVGLVVEANDEEIKFIHSSTQKGVIISSTKEPYYQRTYAQANRVVL